MTKTLLAFDFDGTVTDCDSSEMKIFQHLVPNKAALRKVEEKYLASGKCWLLYWHDFVNEVLALLHSEGVRRAELEEVFHQVPLHVGMKELFSFVSEHRSSFSAVLISDCNSLFLHGILSASGVQTDLFEQIVSCPSHFDSTGKLVVRPYETQSSCEYSTTSLCKAKVLEAMDVYSRWKNVYYFGDSVNDICVSKYIRKERDLLFPKHNSSLHAFVLNNKVVDKKVEIIPWTSAAVILTHLRRVLK